MFKALKIQNLDIVLIDSEFTLVLYAKDGRSDVVKALYLEYKKRKMPVATNIAKLLKADFAGQKTSDYCIDNIGYYSREHSWYKKYLPCTILELKRLYNEI